MDYTTIQTEPTSDTSRKIRAIFRDIEKKARLSGNSDILMMLDRIPFLILGPNNRVPEGAMDNANALALEALEKITEALESGNQSTSLG